MTDIRDSHGRPVPLGAELGRGGEGTVYELADRPETAAKLYLKPPSQETAAKITAMVALATPRLTALAAWPTATLHTARGALAGFTMPKLAGHRPVFQVYGPKLRLRQFPKADWRFLVHAAGNTARAFAVMHEAGLVIGDVNHGNLFVGQDATVQFIDTDSFQVTASGQRFLCEVGVGTHQPPEMQGLASYRGIVRTPNHDNFGLAVLIFQLLCIGRHPFSGRYAGPGEPPDIEGAIAQSRYAYGADSRRTQMTPPPGSLPMDALPGDIRVLFEQAFAPGAAKGGRPTPQAWVKSLGALGESLKKCSVNTAHWYAPQAATCPWCDVESRSGILLFPAVFVPGRTDGAGIAALWQQIDAIPAPPVSPRLHPPTAAGAKPYARIRAAGQRQRTRRLLAGLFLVLACAATVAVAPGPAMLPVLAATFAIAAGFWFFPIPPERREVMLYLGELQSLWHELAEEWQPQADSFAAIKQKLTALKRQYDGLAVQRAKELQSLNANRRELQLAAHLESFELSQARIPGIGKAKVATLLNHGIETIADFEPDRLAGIPGFGPKTVATMLAYRQSCEAQFRFDASKSLAPAEIAKLDRRFGQQMAQIETNLREGLTQLQAHLRTETQRQRSLTAREAELRPVLTQAMANAAALGAR